MALLKLLWWWLLCAWCVLGEPAVRERARGDDILRALGGARGGNLAAVCVRNAEPCAAALWRRGWAVTRASCLSRQPLRPRRVLRLSDRVTCAHLDAGLKRWVSRSVKRTRAHPGWCGTTGASYDLALLQLDRPYEQYDALANVSDAVYRLQDVSPWMQVEFLDYYARHERAARALRPARTPYDKLWLVVLSIVVPGVLFLLTFIFVTRYTGHSVPYTNITTSPPRSSWIEHAYADKVINSCIRNSKCKCS